MEIETVKVACDVVEGNPHGFYVINAEDFDAKVHKKFVEPKTKAKDKDKAATHTPETLAKEVATPPAVIASGAPAATALENAGWGSPPPA